MNIWNFLLERPVEVVVFLCLGLSVGAATAYKWMKNLMDERLALKEEHIKALERGKEILKEENLKLSIQATQQGNQLMELLEKLNALQATAANLTPTLKQIEPRVEPGLPELVKALKEIQVQPRRAEEPVKKSLPNADGPTSVPVLFEMQAVGAAATAQRFGGQFIVLKGSTARKKGNDGWKSNRREQLVKEGKLVENGQEGFFVFTENVPFDSPSGAATMVNAGNLNGTLVWKIKGTQQTYKQWLDENGPDQN